MRTFGRVIIAIEPRCSAIPAKAAIDLRRGSKPAAFSALHDQFRFARDANGCKHIPDSLLAHAAIAEMHFPDGTGYPLATGILLWSILPGSIARAMPESWHWPERMAEKVLGESSQWDAGSRMMQSADPLAWHVLVAVADMQRDNRDKIEDCRKRANSSGKNVSCTLQIRAQTGDD